MIGGILTGIVYEGGRVSVSAPVKLYMGRGQRTPFKSSQRLMVILTRSFP